MMELKLRCVVLWLVSVNVLVFYSVSLNGFYTLDTKSRLLAKRIRLKRQVAQLSSNIAVLVRSPVAISSEPTTITVYRNNADRSVMFDKAVLIGSSVPSQYLQFRDNNPPIPNGAVHNTSSEPATLTLLVTMTTAERTGVYTITVSDGEGSTELRVLITNENAIITAAEYSTAVSQGDSVTMAAVPDEGVNGGRLRWRRDGSFRSSGGGMVAFPTITAQHSEVFECFIAGDYALNIHAIMNLIVRGCPENMTGQACMEECPRCFNGGVCSDETVSCLCPPGFSGDYCENVHGRNVFGQNAEYRCDDTTSDHGDGCQGAIICYPEPFGCICPAGYTGLDCMQECADGKFGANCKQDCHCQDGVTCTKDTGECENNQCSVGWKGINCQVEDPCQLGVFGALCNLPCSCPSGDCSDVESECTRGCAVPWTGVACNNNSGSGVIIELDYVRVNPGVATSVTTCSAVRNPVLGEGDLELLGVEATFISSFISVVGGKNYGRVNTWMITLQSGPVVMATCSIRGTIITQSIQLTPYELLQYDSNRGPLLSFNVITSNSMFVQWPSWEDGTDVGDGPVNEYVIQYREGTQGTFTEAVRTTYLSYQFTGLKVDTLYEFRIVLVREGLNGDGSPSVSQTQRTLCGVPTMSPTLMLESITTRTASFMVEIPPMNQGRCSSITASFQRQESNGLWIEVQSLSSSSVTVDVNDLIPCTSYTFRVQIANTDNSADSQPVDVTTQPEALVLSDLTVSSTNTMGQLDVSWSPPNILQNNCDLSTYAVIYRLVRHVACTSDVIESPNMTENTPSTSITLGDLNDYAEYEVRVRADGEVEGIEMNEAGTTLIAAPSASPMNISVEINSSVSLAFTWQPLPCDQHNGDITNYQFSLRLANGTTVQEGSTEHEGIVIGGLTSYVNYLFTVRAVTSGGPGPESEAVIARTDTESLPQLAPPQVVFSDASVIQILWQTPDIPVSIIIEYSISVQRIGDGVSTSPDVITVDAATAGEPPSYTLTGLIPFSNYSIMVLVVTRIGSSEWSLPSIVETKKGKFPSSSSSLIVLAVLLIVGVIIFLAVTLVIVRRKTRAKRNKDVADHEYADAAKPKDSSSSISLKQKSQKLEVERESGHYEETGPKPSVKVSKYEEPTYLEPSVTVTLDSKTTDHQLERESQLYTEPAPVFKNKKETKGERGGSNLYYNNDGYEETDVPVHSDNVQIRLPDESKKRGIFPVTPQMHAVESLYTRSSETYEELPGFDISQAKIDVSCSIKIKDLPDLLQNKDMDPEDTLRDEFAKLPQGKQHPWTVGALRDENPSSGILPYDRSRVKLEKNSSGSNFDYYNANLIKDQHNDKSVIAAQGPNATNLETFWTMIWDQNIELIVNLSELTGSACQYWPSGVETNKTYGDLTVIWCDNLMDCCDFSIRKMKLIKGDKVHEVKLCHFLSWPETSFPHQPAALLDFIKKVKAYRNKQSLPLLVHCSNGVGATGTFIAIYSLLEGLRNKKKKNRTDVLEFVTKMRNDRVDMVQNENQYTFVYETLTTALLTPETVMSEESLLEMNLDLQKDSLVKEYEVLTALIKVMTPRSSLVGQSPENASKNKSPKVIPLDSCRAVLKSSDYFEGSNDYINASLLNSTGLKDGFIMTQAPLGGTVEDLWRMIYDYECAAIVSLNEMDENDEEVYIYWPEGGKVQHGNMSVKCAGVTTHKDAYIERHLLVKHRKSQKEVAVHHYQLSAWPQHKNQSGALLEIIFKVQPLMKSKQRIAVHCLDGVKRSGIFVAVATEMLHLKTCKEANLFQTIHKLRGKNPHVVKELEDYLLCYQLLKSSLAVEESAYAMIGE